MKAKIFKIMEVFYNQDLNKIILFRIIILRHNNRLLINKLFIDKIRLIC